MGSLRSLFGGKSSALIGIDIGASAVKVLQLSRRGERYSVDACGIEPMPANALRDDGQIADPTGLSTIIKQAVKHSGSNAHFAAVAMPSPLINDKTISLAAGLREQDMEDQINAEFDQHISQPRADVQLDFIRGEATTDDESSVEVQLVASRKEYVEARVAAVETAGLTVRVVDAETYALEGAVELLAAQLPQAERGGTTIAIADIGATRLSIPVLHDQHHVFRHDLNFGGAQLTDAIAERFGLSHDDAEAAKLAPDELPPEYATEVLPHFYDDLAQQIQLAMQYFYSGAQTRYRGAISCLLLAGGGARLPGIAEAIGQRLQLDTQMAAPFATTSFGGRARAKQVREWGPTLLLAAGLALRGFDERH
ncbi:MAG TPA: type IV pilus assembly protein PilM [Nevskiaceae bacterium]|nr:type IV pilus assembly protein PilM [Nevskiaceae bacterium]